MCRIPLKGGDVRAFLTGLKTWHNELTAAGVTITDAEFERTVLGGIPDWLAAYASQLLGTPSSMASPTRCRTSSTSSPRKRTA